MYGRKVEDETYLQPRRRASKVEGYIRATIAPSNCAAASNSALLEDEIPRDASLYLKSHWME